MQTQIDFGYPWWVSYGQLAVLAVVLPIWLLGVSRKWPKAWLVLIGAVVVWALAASLDARFNLNPNERAALPTQSFLASGAGKVLDMGAGTGRSTLMVLEARPQSTVVALDLFGKSYDQHFGAGQNGEERLLANLRVAGVEKRATIQVGDMTKLPFEAASFDGVVSCYAVDHLRREGVKSALSEAGRVLRPGGEFLLMVISKDLWLRVALGPLLLHSGMRGPEGWTSLLREAGFQLVEQGRQPATLYFLGRKQ